MLGLKGQIEKMRTKGKLERLMVHAQVFMHRPFSHECG